MSGITIAIGAVMSFTPTASSQDTASAPQIEAGESIYNNNCQNCHGDRLVNTGQTFDLRRLTAGDRARFDSSVRNGKNQMPAMERRAQRRRDRSGLELCSSQRISKIAAWDLAYSIRTPM
jgi:mono/diheme cytochrome c family protein